MLADIDISVPGIISRWVHIASVIVAVGGTVFIRFVLHPSGQEVLSEEARQSLRPTLMKRWTRFLHLCIGLIIASGIYNTVVMFPKHRGQEGFYHPLWGAKVMLAVILFAIAMLLTSKGEVFVAIRKQAPKLLTVNVLLAAGIVLLSNILKNIPVTTGG